MMNPVYDSKAQLVAWVERNKYIYSKEMIWIAFISNNYVFTKNRKWLGGFINGSFVDTRGNPVGWIQGAQPTSSAPLMVPLTPFAPLAPLTPLTPLTPMPIVQPMPPMGGWSPLSWNTFIS